MHPRKTSEQLREIADAIEQVLEQHAYAMPNPTALMQIEQLTGRFNHLDYYAAEKGGKIAYLAGRFYSVRKHQTHRDGAEGVYREMRHDLLERIRSQANSREYHGD